jgi:hypothetical protein
MSGVPPIAPELVHCGEMTLSADFVAKVFLHWQSKIFWP